MNAVLFRFCVLAVAGWIHRGQQNVIEYLAAENRVLREQLGRDERRRRSLFALFVIDLKTRRSLD